MRYATLLRLLAIIFFFSIRQSFAYQVTALTASYRNGQVFLTWTNPTATNLKYRVYRSSSKITSSTQIGSGIYLGYVMDNSAKNVRKSNVKGGNIYYKIESTGNALASTQGLYVVTCTDNQNWYYAVTVEDLTTHVEEKNITLGQNSLQNSVSESVAAVQPVLQATVNDPSGDVNYEYVVFGNNQNTTGLPAFNNCGSYGYNFTYFQHASGSIPLYVWFQDNDPFSHFTAPTQCGTCNMLTMDDWLPNGETTYWFGYNEAYDIYSPTGNTAFATGVVRGYTQAQVKWIINWALSNYSLDATRVYSSGTSHNGFGAFLSSMVNPQMFAATWGTVAPPMVKALPGSLWEKILAASGSNLPTDILNPNTGLPINIWDVFDCRDMFRINSSIPYIGAVHGKKDTKIGWVQSINWYDSVNVIRQGGVWFWDQRTHTGTGKNFTDSEASINYSRFSTNKSYPAFSYCSINQNPGNGTVTNGDPYGALNGYLDWDDNSISDQPCSYAIKCFIKDMTVNGVLQTQYDTCTSDVTFRRIQNFHPQVGETITWTNYGVNNNLLQSGSFTYDGGVITLTGIKIKRSGSTITLQNGTQLTTYYADTDGDGYGNAASSTQACVPPTGYVTNNGDCNDANNAVHPGQSETCNGVDDNCSGAIDEGVKTTFYADGDSDGYGNATVSALACTAPAGYVLNNTDCNDANSQINPGITEIINGIDDNCNGQVDDLTLLTFYLDADGDGFGDITQVVTDYSQPSGYVSVAGDCNDASAAIHPGVNEICNGVDDNCSGSIDEGVKITFYADADGDSYGNSAISLPACSTPTGYVADNSDCNDANAAIRPYATEICNGVDDNCSGVADEGVKTTYYIDSDGDGYGNLKVTTLACTAPSGYVSNNTDCNDANAAVRPGATELCNSVDDNCNGQIDDGVVSSTVTPSGTVNTCSGSNVSLLANTGSGLTYQWKKNGNNISGATLSSYSATSAATYTVVVTKSTCSATSTGTTLNVITVPAPGINTSSGNNTFCSNSGVYLTTSSSGYTYTWLKGSTVLSGATAQNYTPTSTGSYKVRITDANGCSATSSALSVTVNTAPTPSINGGTAICGNQSVTLSSGSTYSSYLWSTGATTSSINVSMAGTYSLTVTDANNCTGTSSPVTTTAYPLPVPTISASGAVEFCDGGSVNLSVNQTYNAYSWSNNKFTQSQTISASGSYYCTVTDINGCQGISNTITVNEHILPSATVTTSTGATTFCSNSGVYLTTPVTGYSYLWYKGSNSQSGATNQNFTPSSGGTYKVRLSDALGCTKFSSTLSVTVNTAPAPTITGSTSICQGTPTTLSANSTYAHYLWSTGATSQSISTSSAGTYTLTVTDANGCTGTAPSVTTAVYSLPVATISASPGLEFCDGNNITLTATAATSYSWSNGKSSQSITVSSSGNYSVTITDSHGCTAVSSVTANEHILPDPAVITVGPTTYCIGDAASYLTTSANGYSYQWKKGSAVVSGATTQNYQPASSGTYKVQITDNIGCTKLSGTGKSVTANSLPTISISASGSLNICNGETKAITASATGSGITYQWQKNGTTISAATSSTYTASVAGTFTCIVTNNNGCTATSNSIVITANCKLEDGDETTGHASSSVKLFPNPAYSYIHVAAQFAEETNGNALIEIRNLLGEVVYLERIGVSDGMLDTTIPIDGRFANGSYFARICMNDDCLLRKFIIAGAGQ